VIYNAPKSQKRIGVQSKQVCDYAYVVVVVSW